MTARELVTKMLNEVDDLDSPITDTTVRRER